MAQPAKDDVPSKDAGMKWFVYVLLGVLLAVGVVLLARRKTSSSKTANAQPAPVVAPAPKPSGSASDKAAVMQNMEEMQRLLSAGF